MPATYLEIDVVQEPFDLGLDESGRMRWAFNILAYKTYSTTFVQEIIALLVAASVGTYGTTLFATSRAHVPTGDGPFLHVIPTGGLRPVRTHDHVTTPAYQRPGAQLVARAKHSAPAEAMIRAAYAALVGVRNQVVTPA